MLRTLKQLLLPFELAPREERPGRLRQVRLAGGVVSYSLVRARRRTLALLVDADSIEARAPRHVTIAQVETFMRQKERWIRRRLAAPRRAPFVWEAGAQLPWRGQTLTLVVHARDDAVRLAGERLEVGLADGSSLRSRVIAWIRAEALQLFRARVAALARPHSIDVVGIGLSNARTQWGNCSADGRVLLNWRLILMPPHLVDYVVAHELAHRLELNHSARFWDVVARIYPEHRPARRELNALARALPEL